MLEFYWILIVIACFGTAVAWYSDYLLGDPHPPSSTAADLTVLFVGCRGAPANAQQPAFQEWRQSNLMLSNDESTSDSTIDGFT
jgi:hypothetical protein